IKAGLFPLVVNRNGKDNYISALEAADSGELGPLIDVFAQIEVDTVLRAVSISLDEKQTGIGTALNSVVQGIAAKFGQRIRDREKVLRSVNNVGVELRQRGVDRLRASALDAAKQFEEVGLRVRVRADAGGTD